jgi:hypothetical protein
MKRIFILLAATCALTVVLPAQSAPPKQSIPPISAEMLGKGGDPVRAAKGEGPKSEGKSEAADTLISTTNMLYEALITSDASVTVQPGTWWISPQSHLNFAGVERVGIAVTSPYVDLTGLRIFAAWAAVGILFNVTDSSNPFVLLDQGGLFTGVHGPLLKVGLWNGSSVPLEIKQLTVYGARKNAQ